MNSNLAISENKKNTTLLIGLFFIVISLLGYLIGRFVGLGFDGFVFAFIISLISTVVSFFLGDKITLNMNHAKKIERADYPELSRVIEGLAQEAHIPVPNVCLIDDPAMNAFATGRDPNHASIAVTSGLYKNLSETEIQGVLAHEMSHIRNFDIRLNMVVAVLLGTLVMFANYGMRSLMFRGRDNGRGGNIGLVIIGIILIIISPIVGQLIQLAISRQREYLADASGAALAGKPSGLITALEKIGGQTRPMQSANSATAHLYISNPFGKASAVKVFSTHPPIEDRIARLRSLSDAK